jgi:hypothetical protein
LSESTFGGYSTTGRRSKRHFGLSRIKRPGSLVLGHADPGFTLRTYVHLMDEGIGDAAFFDAAVAPERTAAQGARG